MSTRKRWRPKDAAANSRGKRSAALRSKHNAWPAQKNWKLMYTRSAKTLRARQLGFDYPRRTVRELLDEYTCDDE